MRFEITPRGQIRAVDPSNSPDRVDAVLIALSGAVGGVRLSLDDVDGGGDSDAFNSNEAMDRLSGWAGAPREKREAEPW